MNSGYFIYEVGIQVYEAAYNEAHITNYFRFSINLCLVEGILSKGALDSIYSLYFLYSIGGPITLVGKKLRY